MSFFPAVRERVLIQGSDDIFLVVSVDLERGVADLIPIRDGGQPAEDVPLSSLRPSSSLPDAGD